MINGHLKLLKPERTPEIKMRKNTTGNIQGLNEALLRFNLVLNEAQVA